MCVGFAYEHERIAVPSVLYERRFGSLERKDVEGRRKREHRPPISRAGYLPVHGLSLLGLAGRGGEGAHVVPEGVVLGEDVVGVDLVLGGQVGVVGVCLRLVRLQGLKERGGGPGREEDGEDGDVLGTVYLGVDEMDLQRHVGEVDGVLRVVEVELEEFVVGAPDLGLEGARVGDNHLPRPLLELNEGFARVPGEGHGPVRLVHGCEGGAHGLDVDGAGRRGSGGSQ